jgi:hypothetical protein
MPEQKYLTRREAADFLCALGLRVAPTTLAKYASVGGGPLMRHFGRRVLYDPSALLEWANGKLSEPCRSTSERLGRWV